MRKTWIKIKRGLLEPEHREKMGVRVWLYMYMVDKADWETGTIDGWVDAEHAKGLGMEHRTLQAQRQQLQIDGYITCDQVFQAQKITIHNWINPREYSGEVYNGTAPDVTPGDHGTRSRVPIRTESRVPLHIDHIYTTYKLDVPEPLRTIEFSDAWFEWEKHRREIKKKLTPTSVKKQLKLLAEYDCKTAIEMINTSILSSWQGIFRPKTRVNGRPDTDPQPKYALVAEHE